MTLGKLFSGILAQKLPRLPLSGPEIARKQSVSNPENGRMLRHHGFAAPENRWGAVGAQVKLVDI